MQIEYIPGDEVLCVRLNKLRKCTVFSVDLSNSKKIIYNICTRTDTYNLTADKLYPSYEIWSKLRNNLEYQYDEYLSDVFSFIQGQMINKVHANNLSSGKPVC